MFTEINIKRHENDINGLSLQKWIHGLSQMKQILTDYLYKKWH